MISRNHRQQTWKKCVQWVIKIEKFWKSNSRVIWEIKRQILETKCHLKNQMRQILKIQNPFEISNVTHGLIACPDKYWPVREAREILQPPTQSTVAFINNVGVFQSSSIKIALARSRLLVKKVKAIAKPWSSTAVLSEKWPKSLNFST